MGLNRSVLKMYFSVIPGVCTFSQFGLGLVGKNVFAVATGINGSGESSWITISDNLFGYTVSDSGNLLPTGYSFSASMINLQSNVTN